MNDILQRVEQVFIEKTLIGNHDFTEDEYSALVDYVGALHDNFDKNSYKLIFITLVEIAKRWKQSDTTGNEEENSGYWDQQNRVNAEEQQYQGEEGDDRNIFRTIKLLIE